MTQSRKPRLFVDVHVVQTLPPSNVNRDDTGSPKQAMYGGVRRARVSSQAWKRAARLYLADRQPVESQGTRTKRLAALIADGLAMRSGLDHEAALRIGVAAVAASGITMDGKKQDHTSYLLFFGYAQVDRIVNLLEARASELSAMSDKELKAALTDLAIKGTLGSGHPMDVVLFGRMVADLADLNVDAATQVAHAISSHAVDIEFDYYTAVDDQNTREETGAGMIGTVEFNSATFYRYATVAAHQLVDEISDPQQAASACAAFVEAFAKSVPSGHRHSFAHQTRPRCVLVVIRSDQPVNLVTAFERPVTPHQGDEARGVEAASIGRLAHELRRGVQMWGDQPVLIAATYDVPDELVQAVEEAMGPSRPFSDVLEVLADVLGEKLVAVPG